MVAHFDLVPKNVQETLEQWGMDLPGDMLVNVVVVVVDVVVVVVVVVVQAVVLVVVVVVQSVMVTVVVVQDEGGDGVGGHVGLVEQDPAV